MNPLKLRIPKSFFGLKSSFRSSEHSRDHSFGTFGQLSEKLTFLPPDKHRQVCVSEGKKFYFFREISWTHKINDLHILTCYWYLICGWRLSDLDTASSFQFLTDIEKLHWLTINDISLQFSAFACKFDSPQVK